MDILANFYWGPFIAQALVATLLSGSIVGLILKFLLDRKVDKHHFTRDWKERSLSIVVGPVVMHLNRTDHVAERYRTTTHKLKKTSYFDAKLMRDSNESLRSILLSNGHLLPRDLREHAHKLVAHYDEWLRNYDMEVAKHDAESSFNVGFAKERFPKDAAKAFQAWYDRLQEELYGIYPEESHQV